MNAFFEIPFEITEVWLVGMVYGYLNHVFTDQFFTLSL